MIYSFTSRVRYSETDRNSVLTFPALLDYFQDTSTFHGEDNNLTLSLLYEQKITWVLGAWQIRLHGMPKLGETVTVSTWARQFSHCLGYRNYTMSGEDGALLAAADTQYMLIHTDTQEPAQIPDDMIERYTLEKDRKPDLRLSRKIRPETAEELFPALVVQPYMIDSNQHVNNAQYVKTAMAYLPEDYSFNCFRAEYKKQARLHDTLYPAVSETASGMQVKFYNAAHNLYFIGEWTDDTHT